MNDYQDVKKLADLLDTKFKGPLGLRFGWDAIIGLIPGVGDMITSGVSFYIIYVAARMGVDSSTLVRMGINLLIDNVIDVVPIIGNLFDFYWKANDKNMRLIEKHMANPGKQTIRSRMVLTLLAVALLLCLALSFYGAYLVFKALYLFITT